MGSQCFWSIWRMGTNAVSFHYKISFRIERLGIWEITEGSDWRVRSFRHSSPEGTAREILLWRGWFAIASEPVEENAMPQDTVLRGEHPVALFWKVEESRRHFLNLSGGEGFDPLSNRDTEIFLAVDHQKRGFPIGHESMRGEAIVVLLNLLILPVGPPEIPIDEEQFLG